MTDEERKTRAEKYGPRAQFTLHELDVLDYLCAGLTSIETAIEVKKSKNAVDQTLKAIRNYTGAVNGVGLAMWCVRNRVVTLWGYEHDQFHGARPASGQGQGAGDYARRVCADVHASQNGEL